MFLPTTIFDMVWGALQKAMTPYGGFTLGTVPLG